MRRRQCTGGGADKQSRAANCRDLNVVTNESIWCVMVHDDLNHAIDDVIAVGVIVDQIAHQEECVQMVIGSTFVDRNCATIRSHKT